MRTAQLFDNAVGHRSNGKVCKDYGDLVLIDKPLATALHMAALSECIPHLADCMLGSSTALDTIRSTLYI